MITLYGVTRSRAFRCMWLLEEMGVPYERVLTTAGPGGSHEADYLAVNPNGKLPALVDGDVALFESLAINLYLAGKYGNGTMMPTSPEDRGRAYQWSVWAMTELDPMLIQVLRHRVLWEESRRDPAMAAQAERDVMKPLGVLDAALRKSPTLAGDSFSVADLNVAAVTTWAKLGQVPLDGFPTLQGWLEQQTARPAFVKARKS
jgi:glutathione S-transferase